MENPYTPGAGFMPAYLAGRETLIEDAEKCLENIQRKYPQRSVIYYGLRGVGKTVLLNRIEEAAENRGILYAHLEATEPTKQQKKEPLKFTAKLLHTINRFAFEISTKEKAKEFARRCLLLLRSFALTYNLAEGSLSLSTNQEVPPASGDYADDLTELLVQLGRAAARSETAICIFIDEVQYLSEEEIGGLIAALHRCNQLRLPIMLFCAGLPKILKTAGEAYSYAERLFKFETVAALTQEETAAAVTEPAAALGVAYTDEAVRKIIAITACYPYFIQQFCSVVWEQAGRQKTITLEAVDASEKEFLKVLDSGFFAVRYDRCTKQEKVFMTAMAKCEKLPCTISNVASIMNRTGKSISPLRGRLINKGMIYPTAHAEIDFTVPKFDAFLRRINPRLSLD